MGSKGRPYRTFVVDGFEVLVGRGEDDNDHLTFRVAEPHDVWMHVGGGTPGSHVVVRNPEKGEVPRAVLEAAAALAAWYSKARAASKVEVSYCRAADVSKPWGAAPASSSSRGTRRCACGRRSWAERRKTSPESSRLGRAHRRALAERVVPGEEARAPRADIADRVAEFEPSERRRCADLRKIDLAPEARCLLLQRVEPLDDLLRLPGEPRLPLQLLRAVLVLVDTRMPASRMPSQSAWSRSVVQRAGPGAGMRCRPACCPSRYSIMTGES